jgi:large subunit ribosomal protein L2
MRSSRRIEVMGKRIIVRRRGRGSATFKAPTHRRVGAAGLPPVDIRELSGVIMGKVKDLVHDPGRGAPIALIEFENGQECYLPAPEELSLGREISRGITAPPEIGNILPLKAIPEGTIVCNIELSPGDGGKIARSSGTYAMVVAHTPAGVQVKLPSGRSVYIDERCRAVIGVVAGSGRIEKPFLKAGAHAKLMASRGRRWPNVRGQAMIAASHPFGGGRHRHPGKPTTVSRHAPPGRKVGHIAARKTGRAKSKRRA